MTTLAVMRTPTTIHEQEYDRSPLRAEEIEALDDVAARRGGGAWAPKASRDLARLVAPIHDAINSLRLATDRVGTLGNKQSYASARLRVTWPILRQVYASGRTYWEWSEQEWCALIEHGRKEGRVPKAAVAYALCGIRPNLHRRLNFSYSYLYKIVFGQTAWDQIEPN
jgi:hypothetical protein